MTSQGTERLRASLIGTTLVGEGGTKFWVRELLGEGGQGWVFKANYDDPDGFWIVVKILRPEGLSRETLDRFERETKVLQMLGAVSAPNPNIIRFYDHGLHRLELFSAQLVVPFIALELVDGPTLGAVIDSYGGRGMPLDRATRLMRQVARALHTVHEHRIVHRDLKPSNILLANQQGREVAKVTDFGLVKAPGLSAKATATIAGATLGYAPPEQYEMGNNRVTSQTDVFSFAAILFETLCGRAAFPHKPGESPLRTVAQMLSGDRPQLARNSATLAPDLMGRRDLVAALDREIARATAADPASRHASLQDLWNAVEPTLRSANRALSEAEGFRSPAPTRATSAPDVPAPNRPSGAGLRFTTISLPMPHERLRSCVFAPEERAIYAVGMTGVYRHQGKSWSPLSLPSGLDVRRLRGVAMWQEAEVLLFGESGLAAILGPSGARALPGVDGDYNWLGAFTDDGDCVLAGERPGRSVGVLAEVGTTAGHVHTLPGTTRLHAATRLASGSLLGCGGHGDLVQVLAEGHREVSWGKSGHLFSVARNNTGGAFVVGSGGHALAITARTSIGTTISSEVLASLETVQTTQDIVSVKVDPEGTPWAVGHNARLLVRRGAVWTRLPIEGTTANLIAVAPLGRNLTLVAEDGTVIEARE